ncbi:MAG: AAA family ATPase, partial [Candidatus Dadabacteria bacterium]|nr:AAA family ATPase [Candidatus Dadabacteria bacterium]NIT13803.1 AAA family ATPase [Candidatus Dadabacteria bacterium]
MKLVKIEFNGFKSFYEKTKIDFHSNINAIVGPNGCGKSNIIDAIKWVMGEQNPRNLRAMTMEEVISNGGETLKPLGMAEVSIVISSNGTGYEEINVKRRLFRSGQSEYYINNVPCRLKDITELFVDTGVGARAYSIIGQGKVESIIMSKPEGKREVIEEVAGIGKYKLRRKETQSRIESTKNNLTVVRESQSEILRQIKSLKKQAQDAERYKQIAEQIEQIENKVLVKNKNELIKSKTEIESMRQSVGADISNHLQTVGGLKSSREDTLCVIENIDREADILKNKYFEDTKKLQSLDNEIELTKREETTLYETISTIRTDLINCLKEIQNIKNITAQKHSELKSTLITLQEKQNELSVKQKLTDSYKNDLITKKQEYKQHREGLLKSLDEYGSVKTKVVGIEKDVKELESRIYRLKKEKADIENKISLNTARLRHHENELRKTVLSYTDVGRKLNNTSKELDMLQRSQYELMSNLEDYRDQYSQAKSELAAIEKIQSNYEWLPNEISKFILDHKGKEVVGLLADFIDVDQSYDKAVEAALGEKLKWTVINNLSDGFELIDLVNRQRTGKGTFLPLNLFKDKSTEIQDKIDLKPLLEVIEADHKIGYLLSSLLDKVYITDSLRSIQNIDEKLKSGYSFVTLGGDYIDSSGFISTGDSSEGVFERKREIDQLSGRTSELIRKIQELDTELSSIQTKSNSLSTIKSQLEANLKELEIKEAGLNKDVINLKNICKSDLDSLDSIVFETKSYQAERGNKVLSLSDLGKYINELELKKTQFETGFKNLDSELRELEDKDQQISTYVNQSKVEIAGLKEKINGLEQELSYYLLRQKELGIKIIIQQSDFKKLTYKKAGIVRSKIALGRDKEDLKAHIAIDSENMSK